MISHRTDMTLGSVRRADDCTEFHEGLIQKGTRGRGLMKKGTRRVRRLHQYRSLFPKPPVSGTGSRIALQAVHAAQDSHDISVQGGHRLPEGDATNRACGVTANPGQGQYVWQAFGKTAAMVGHDELGGFLQVARAAVVAEPFPQFKHLFRGGGRQGLNLRQIAHPASPVREDGFDLRLLEHDLGHPNGVWIPRAAPGQGTGVGAEPFDQQVGDCTRSAPVRGRSKARIGVGIGVDRNAPCWWTLLRPRTGAPRGPRCAPGRRPIRFTGRSSLPPILVGSARTKFSGCCRFLFFQTHDFRTHGCAEASAALGCCASRDTINILYLQAH